MRHGAVPFPHNFNKGEGMKKVYEVYEKDEKFELEFKGEFESLKAAKEFLKDKDLSKYHILCDDTYWDYDTDNKKWVKDSD
jgi:hypothetical protein